MSGSALTLLKTPISICFVFVVLLSSCANDKAFEPVPMVIDTTCIPNGYQVTYTQDIKLILEHTAPILCMAVAISLVLIMITPSMKELRQKPTQTDF